ncbi:MAG: mannose-1-phosphate guanylyltransferase [Oceanipulchritudo sp.]
MKQNRYVVIMAGGRGERFWPQSRLSRPKHLLPIVGDKPMLTQTVERLGDLVPPERVLIITNSEQREAVLEVCPMVPAENVIPEPVGRDTAAAVGLATVLVGARDPEACFAMLPADHVIHDEEGFRKVLGTAFAAAEAEKALVTIGIRPDYPATGYGYIHRGGVKQELDGRPVFEVLEFKEKPDLETATRYVDSGEYHWNGGMFFWRVPVISAEFEKHTPGLWAALGAIREGLRKGGKLEDLLAKHYPNLEKISVDFAIMEKAASVRVVESAFDWDDVGEWPAVERHYPRDEAGNVTKGQVVIREGSGNIVVNDGRHTTAVIGAEDLIIVQTPDATLVCPKDKAQEIKKLVKALGKDEKYEHLL